MISPKVFKNFIQDPLADMIIYKALYKKGYLLTAVLRQPLFFRTTIYWIEMNYKKIKEPDVIELERLSENKKHLFELQKHKNTW